jgi:hypothetical protein
VTVPAHPTYVNSTAAGANFTFTATYAFQTEGNFGPLQVSISNPFSTTPNVTVVTTVKVDQNAVSVNTVSVNSDPFTPLPQTISVPRSTTTPNVNLQFTFTDPNGAQTSGATSGNFLFGEYEALVDWTGTGTYTALPASDITYNAGTGVFTVTASMMYPNAGTDTINVEIVHGQTAGFIATTPNPAPPGSTLTAVNLTVTQTGVIEVSQSNYTAVEGLTNPSEPLLVFSDPAGLGTGGSTYSANISWGDGQMSSGVITLNSPVNGQATVSGAIPTPYHEAGTYPITITVTHTDGMGNQQTNMFTTSAIISDAPLTAGAQTPVQAVEGTPLNNVVVAVFTDTNPFGVASDLSATVTWGDGQSSTGTVQASGGQFQVVATKPQAYVEAGNYAITVNIVSVHGSTLTISNTAVVADAPLTGSAISFTGIATIANSLQVAGFNDTNPFGVLTDFSATIAWGDGTTTGGTVTGTGVTNAVSGTHTYQTSGTFTFTVTIHDAGGSNLVLTGTATITAAPDVIATGSDVGGGPEVKVFNSTTHALQADFYAFPATFTGGVRVAVGDVNGDGVPDVIVAAGIGGMAEIRVFDGANNYQPMAGPLGGFYAMVPSFSGGLYVAVGDVLGAGYDDIIVGYGAGGGPLVNVYDGQTANLIGAFYATAPSFTGGVRVAAGDVEGIKRDDILATFGPGSASIVEVINFQSLSLAQVIPVFGGQFTGGLFVAAGDVNGDGHADVIVSADAGGGPEVMVFDGAHSGSLLNAFFADIGGQVDIASPNGFPMNGVRVGTAIVNGKTVITTMGGPGSLPLVTDLDGVTLQQIDAFYAYDPTVFRFGGFVS